MNPDPTNPRPNWFAVGGCIFLIIAWMMYSNARWPAQPVPLKPHALATAPVVVPERAVVSLKPVKTSPAPAPAIHATPTAPEQHLTLENDQIRATFTSYGGALNQVEMKQHAVNKGTIPVVLNADRNNTELPPIFALSGWEEASPVSYTQEADRQQVTYRRTLANGIQLERIYTLGKEYQITLEQRVTNPTKAPILLPDYELQVGAAESLYANDQPTYVAATWLAANDQFGRTNATEFALSNGFLGFGAHPARDFIESPTSNGTLRWAAVKNRFFTIVLQPPAENPIESVISRPAPTSPGSTQLSSAPVVPRASLPGIVTSAHFFAFTLAPGQTRTEKYLLYAGPKDHSQLTALGQGEEAIMEFGWWGWVAVPLSAIMEWMHQWIPNYGWVIVVLTLLLKIIFWPLQSTANHSMKKMQALAPRQKELSAKYKEDPQRMQVELMKLYKEYGVNPIGGCLPILIQIPIFFGFYTMLQSAGQFQHQSWLWVHDLVQPDTIGVIPGLNIPINPLPIIMALSQYVLMKLTPQAGGTDNPQMKLMQWMPFVMLFIFYNFASALALYWTVNNLVSMVQTYRNLRKPIPALQRVKKSTGRK